MYVIINGYLYKLNDHTYGELLNNATLYQLVEFNVESMSDADNDIIKSGIKRWN